MILIYKCWAVTKKQPIPNLALWVSRGQYELSALRPPDHEAGVLSLSHCHRYCKVFGKKKSSEVEKKSIEAILYETKIHKLWIPIDFQNTFITFLFVLPTPTPLPISKP
jgi:hypothetical protein